MPVISLSMSDTAPEADYITPIDDVQDRLKALSLDEFSKLVDSSLYIGTQATGELDGNPSSIISRSHVEVGADGSYAMYMASG